MRRWSLGTMTAALTVGCTSQPRVDAPPAAPDVRVGRLFPKPDSLKASQIAVTLEVRNPGRHPIVVHAIDYAVDTRDVSGVLTGTVESGATLEARQLAELEFTVQIPFPKEPLLFRAVLERGTLPLTVQGNVRFEDGAVVPFERNGAVATPTFPRLIVHEVQSARYGEEGVDVTFFLRLLNENPFAVTIGNVTYTIRIEGTEAKSAQGAIGVRLAQGAAQEFEVVVIIDETTFKNVKEILRSGRVRYGVRGHVSVGRYEQPYAHEGKIVLASGL